MLICSMAFFGESPVWLLRSYRSSPHQDRIRELMRAIPPRAAVSAQEPYVAHLTSRRKLYQFPMVSDAEYVFLDSAARKWPLSDEEYFQKAAALLRRGFRVKASAGTVLLLEKGVPQTPEESRLPLDFLGYAARDERRGD